VYVLPCAGDSTVTITRVGTNQKYSDGWDKAFGKGGKSSGAKAAKPAAKQSAKKAPVKKAGKKGK
jgi:hypothetical protein